MRKYYRFPRRYRNRNKEKKPITRRGILIAAAGCILVYFLISSFVIRTYRISGESMAPTLKKDSVVLAVPSFYVQLKRVDVVLYIPEFYRKAPFWISFPDAAVRFFTGQKFSPAGMLGYDTGCAVKRVAGLPGEKVRISDGQLYIRLPGEKYSLPAAEYGMDNEIIPSDTVYPNNIPETELGPDEYFLISDNRNYISDSVSLGAVEAGRIKAKVIRFSHGK